MFGFEMSHCRKLNFSFSGPKDAETGLSIFFSRCVVHLSEEDKKLGILIFKTSVTYTHMVIHHKSMGDYCDMFTARIMSRIQNSNSTGKVVSQLQMSKLINNYLH